MKKVGKILKGIIDTSTGKTIEEKVNQYSEVYGEILLGMHRDLVRQRKLIADYRQDMTKILDEAKRIAAETKRSHEEHVRQVSVVTEESRAIRGEMRSQAAQTTRLQYLGIVAFLLSLLAIGTAIWTLI